MIKNHEIIFLKQLLMPTLSPIEVPQAKKVLKATISDNIIMEPIQIILE